MLPLGYFFSCRQGGVRGTGRAGGTAMEGLGDTPKQLRAESSSMMLNYFPSFMVATEHAMCCHDFGTPTKLVSYVQRDPRDPVFLVSNPTTTDASLSVLGLTNQSCQPHGVTDPSFLSFHNLAQHICQGPRCLKGKQGQINELGIQ